MLRTGILLGLIVAGFSAEDPKRELRAVWDQAGKGGDLWTVLQAEAAAKRIDLKLGPALGTASAVYGDPLWAFPSDLDRLWDKGEVVLVASAGRVYRLAGDGRPLSPSVGFPFGLGSSGVNHEGTIVGAMEKRHGVNTATGVALAIPGGEQRLNGAVALANEDSAWGAVVASDGTAIAMTVEFRPEKVPAPPNPRVAVIRNRQNDGRPAVLEGFRDPWAVGPDGRWLLAHETGSYRPMLITAAGPQRIVSGDAGLAGWAAVLNEQRQLALVDPTGAQIEPPPAMGISADRSGLDSIGGWLVVASGAGAKAPALRSLLDEPVQGSRPQPFTLALWRWSALVADPNSEPILIEAPALSRANHEAAAVYTWTGAELSLLDLSGPQPTTRLVLTAPGDIRSADSRYGRIRVRMSDRRWLIADADGRPLWLGTADECDLQDRWWAVASEGKPDVRTFRVIRLAADAAERKEVTQALPPGPWHLHLDRLGRTSSAIQHGQSWVTFDPTSGQVRKEYRLPDEPYRQYGWRVHLASGRFYAVDARVFDHRVSDDGKGPGGFFPIDAWRAGPAMIALCRRGNVVLSGGPRSLPGQKSGAWLHLGVNEAAQQFAQRGRGEPCLRDNDGRVCGVFAAGPVLIQPARADERTEPVPPGPWRLNGDQFTPPRQSGIWNWNRAAAGFDARRLRSPDSGGLLVVTPSLVLDLDESAARAVAQPAKNRGD